MKICKDCKHYKHWPDGVKEALRVLGEKELNCFRKDKGLTIIDKETGKNVYVPEILNAQEERNSIWPWRCGKKARYFEPKSNV